MARTRKPSGNKPSRGPRSYARSPGNRPPHERILIVCEGEETEPNYFNCVKQKLRLAAVNIEIPGKAYDPSALVNYALRKRKEGKRHNSPFDEVWCVMDREATRQPAKFLEAVNTANDNEIKLVVSNPAFEFWFLLHFKHTDRPFANADDLIRDLKKHIPDYEKSSNVFRGIFERTDVAVGRAKHIQENRPDRDDPFPNPSTGVYMLVEKLRNAGKSKQPRTTSK